MESSISYMYLASAVGFYIHEPDSYTTIKEKIGINNNIDIIAMYIRFYKYMEPIGYTFHVHVHGLQEL